MIELETGGALHVAAGGAHHVNVAADHEAREAGRRLLHRVHLGDNLAMTQDRHVVAEPLHLLEAMADVDHRTAFAGEARQGDEKLVCLLRGEHRCGLVHNQELRLLQQAAHDLDPLALAHGKVGHHGGGL